MPAARERPGAEMFVGEDGQLCELARREHFEVLAGLFFLSRWRRLGAVEAGRLTCERYGHGRHLRGGRCERCGGSG